VRKAIIGKGFFLPSAVKPEGYYAIFYYLAEHEEER
jgi:hypothetical protein